MALPVFWLGLERSEPLWQNSTQLGKPGTHTHSSSTMVEITGWDWAVLALSSWVLGWGWCGESKTIFLILFNASTFRFFSSSYTVLELLCWTPKLPQRYYHLWVIVKTGILCGEDNRKFLFCYSDVVTLLKLFKILVGVMKEQHKLELKELSNEVTKKQQKDSEKNYKWNKIISGMQTKLEGRANEHKEHCVMKRNRWKEGIFLLQGNNGWK